MSCASQMIRSTTRQRRERMFQWNRLKSDKAVHKDLVFKEEANSDIFANVMKNYRETWNKEVRERMDGAKIAMEDAAWSRRVVPRQKEIQEFPETYQGCRKIGRSYGFILTNIPTKIVNTLYMDTHRYIDTMACFPTILLNAGDHLDVEALRGFVTNRDEIFSLMWRNHRINSASVKSAVNSMIGACPRLPADFGLGPGRDDDVRTLSEHPFIVKLQSELVDIANDIAMEYPEYYEGIKQMCINRGDESNVHGVALSYFCQDVEDACMRAVVEFIRKPEDDDLAKNMLWKYDGLLIPKSLAFPIGPDGQPGEPDDDTFLQGVQAAVYDACGIHLRFSFKDISSASAAYQDCGVDVIVDAYQKWKKVFDLQFVKFKNPPRYGRLMEDGSYQLLSYGSSGSGGDFGFLNREQPQDFIEQWVKDPTKIVYQGMDFAPPPRQSKPGYLNTYRGFAVDRLSYDMTPEEIKTGTEPFLRHLKHMSGFDDMVLTFMIKYIAHLFQKPGVKSEKIIYVRSVQGTGKDQMFHFLSYILGRSMTHKAGNTFQVKGVKSSNLENRLLVALSECNHLDFKDYEFLKDICNRSTFTVCQKYVPEYTASCFLNLWMYCNQFYGMGITMDDRRFVIMEADPRIANVPSYHIPFAAYINEPINQYAAYRYFKDMDIGDFFPGNCDTKTRVMKQMASLSFNYAAWFLQENFSQWLEWATDTGSEYRRVSDDYLKVSSPAFFSALKSFAEKMKMTDKDTTQKLNAWGTAIFTEAANKMAKYCPVGVEAISSGDGKDRMRTGSGARVRCRTFYIPAVQQFINETCVDDDFASDDEGEEEVIMVS